MTTKSHDVLRSSCVCGNVVFETTGKPIACVKCYCTSCREAGRRFERLVDAPDVVDDDGGTGAVLVRKDRVRCVRGAERLSEHRLNPASPTRRVVASCCNSPMFLDFTRGFWLTMYRNRFVDRAPPVEVRVMTGDREPGVDLADDMPNYAGHSGKFMGRMLSAWIAMGLRRPDISYGRPR